MASPEGLSPPPAEGEDLVMDELASEAVRAEDVASVEPVVRRVVMASHVRNPADVDDLVHDTLERLLRAHRRLSPEALVPFAVVTAKNLIISRSRERGRRDRNAHRLADLDVPESPADAALGTEVKEAMSAALAQLSADERDALLAYQSRPTGQQMASGAARVRMARIRAKLRVEFIVAFRHVELPSAACRPVLVSISAGDTRRQASLGSGDHLVECSTCAELSEPLSRRSLALTAIIPLGLARWVVRTAKAHPLGSAAAGAVAAGGVAAGALLAVPHPVQHVPPPMQHTVDGPGTTLPSPVLPHVTVDHLPLHPAMIRSFAGDAVRAFDVQVEAVVTHDGFWVGPSAGDRVWVELVGPLRALQVKPGETVRFDGTVVSDGRNYPVAAGVTAAGGAALLDHEGAHIEVETPDLTVASR
jgi:RNA polymerase sigma factor (sigma-70 family)